MAKRSKNPCGMTVKELRDHIWRIGSEYALADAIGRSVHTVKAWQLGKTNVHPRVAKLIRALPSLEPPLALTREMFETAVLEYGGPSHVAYRYGFPFLQVADWVNGYGVPPNWLLQELEGCFTVVEK
jgi:hypothetical protein